jgi:hypothetical protein
MGGRVGSVDKSFNLTGIWNGIYNYPAKYEIPESHFLATLIEFGGSFSGSIHEIMQRRGHRGVKANASVEGKRTEDLVTFVKLYDGGGLSHSVHYEGHLSLDGCEIEGHWHIPHEDPARVFAGRFLMIRRRAAKTQQTLQERFEHTAL